ncbi:MAG: hypothetical protein IRZ33_04340 [Alicyclobacillaceae bacterium]|nr:hypothetical protein [Alicyclobacillaceae bacterium]
MNGRQAQETFRQKRRAFDRRVAESIRVHSTLITAVAVFLILLWGLFAGYVWFVLMMIVLGAVSYFLGLTLALVCAGAFTVVDGYEKLAIGYPVSALLLESAGFAFIAWLGFRHREEKEQEAERMAAQRKGEKAPQVLPWAAVNEIRTSLAAVRFLLFPLNEEDQNLKKAADEISRLETLFQEMEKQDQTGTQR